MWVTAVGAAAHGTASCTASCTYQANAGYTGPDSFTYTITDTRGATASATVQVTVVANAAPVAVDDSWTVRGVTAGGKTYYVYPQTNDTDPDGDYRTITSNTAAAHGTATCWSYGCSYTPEAGYGGADTITYTISDGHGGTDSATIAITVVANTAPVAVDDTLTAAETQQWAQYLYPVHNDTDADGDALRLLSYTQPAHGTVSCPYYDYYYDYYYYSYYTYCSYTPTAGYSGPDSFTYTIEDGYGGTATATVAVTVQANQPPVAVDDAVTGLAEAPIYVNAVWNDYLADPDRRVLRLPAARVEHRCRPWHRHLQHVVLHLHRRGRLRGHRHLHVHDP